MPLAPPKKKSRTKPSKSRPVSVSAITQPVTQNPSGLLSGVALGEDKDGSKAVSNKRYTESRSVVIRSGIELGQDAAMDDPQTADADGILDVDLAELSLGQRLTALSGNPVDSLDDRSDSDERLEPSGSKDPASKENDPPPASVPASSLTRTLIQALHSSDAGLLEACLTHTNATLIQNTVQRLPPQLAVPLITACVERLGRGKGVGRGKGGGAAAGAQRATGLVRWIRAVLIIHGGHLLTLPDLVARLAGLHTTLTTRLTLQDSLHSLSGRLDMVISQIELRSSTAPAPLPLPGKGKGKEKGKAKQQRIKNAKPIRKYVEGESEEDEPEWAGMEVQVESAGEEGSVEDVELGGSDREEDDAETSEEEEEEESEQEDDEDDEDEDEDSDFGGGTKLNGFIDDEAEEFSAEDDEDESD